jgi:DNA-directed RNA polymerase subunit omega
MNTELLKTASEIIPSPQMLVNVISRRVRQLSRGHRPLVQFPPGMGLCDIALSEVGQRKLTFESTPGDDSKLEPAPIALFPSLDARKKAA